MATDTAMDAAAKPNARLFAMEFGSIYPHYVTKVEKKGRTKRELDEVLRWFTGYNQRQLTTKVRNGTTLGDFIDGAPELHPHRSLITGVVCGVRVEDIEEPMLREVRYTDKLVDELAKGKAMEKVLRAPAAAGR